MPLLNNRETGKGAAGIQLGLLKRDVHATRDIFTRSTDVRRSGSTGTAERSVASPVSAVARGSSFRSGGTSLTTVADILRPECGNPACPGSWTPPWRSRRYPFFEERWACSQRCMLSMVKLSIAREIGDGVLEDSFDSTVQHRHRVPLGLVMLAQGWITHPQLRKALDMQRLKGTGRIGDWLISECGLRSEWITRGLSVQWNCPVLTTEGFSPETMARAIPRQFIEDFGILPVRVAGRRILYVGFQDQIDASSAFAVEQISGLRTECGVIGEERYRKARDLVLGCRFVEMKRVVVADRDALARSIERIIVQQKPTSSRLVRLHKYYWLRLWQESEGSVRATRPLPAAGEAADYLFTIGS